MPSPIINKNEDKQKETIIGVISDTHGLLRPQVAETFADVDLILHAGDVGGPDILSDLQAVAPLIAVRGNMDYGSWAEILPVVQSIQVGNHHILLVHDVGWIDRDIDLTNYQAVITGHTHRPLIELQNQLLYFNPGSAGHRRRHYPISVGKLLVRNGQLVPNLIELEA
jgi:putative phosphoesterase